HFEPFLPDAPGRDDFMVVCVSCHSPRYVLMQPLFRQRQWEESVDKMAKTYGAQMDPDQRKSIIAYLVTIHGPDAAAVASVRPDDEVDATFQIARPSPLETAPLLQVAMETAGHAGELSRGSDLFGQDCAGCHGTAGRG